MMCAKCAADPETHSFRPITMVGDVTIFLTSAKHNKDFMNGDDILSHLANALEPLRVSKKPWIWVVDCRGIGAAHAGAIGITKQLTMAIKERYYEHMYGTILLNPPTAMNALVSLSMQIAGPTASVKTMHGSPLELYMEFQKQGWKPQEVAPLIQELRKDA
jgi:hypothetical protein